jgi:ParB family chromosome partitioning protein
MGQEASAGPGYELVPIAALYPNPANPRKRIDEEALAKLTESIHQVGILEPLLVVPDDTGFLDRDSLQVVSDRRYRIVFGERRYRAALAAGLQKVPVIIRELTPAQEFTIMLTENLQREDLNALEEAEAYRAATDRGWTQERLAAELGISQETISKRIRLLSLPEEIREIILRGIISPSHGLALCKVAHRPKLAILLAEKLKGVSVARAEETIDGYIRDNGNFHPLFMWHAYNSPKFNPDQAGCSKCVDRILVKTEATAEHRHPWCLNRKCWADHQAEAEQVEKECNVRAAVESGVLPGVSVHENVDGDSEDQTEKQPLPQVPEIVNLDPNSYERFGQISRERCDGCQLILSVIGRNNQVEQVCTDPGCMANKIKDLREDEEAQREAEAEDWEREKLGLIKAAHPFATPVDGTWTGDWALNATDAHRYLVYMVAQAARIMSASWDDYSVIDQICDLFGWTPPTFEEWSQEDQVMAYLVEKLKTLNYDDLKRALFVALLWPVGKGDYVYQLTLGTGANSQDEPGTSTWVCRVCGCTDDHACEGGCSWVEKDLCSQCVGSAESEVAIQ